MRPSINAATLAEICAVQPPVSANEPVLLRIVVADNEDIEPAATLILSETEKAFRSGRMPTWWPLIQGVIDEEGWRYLIARLGDAWAYVNVAVNPFMAGNCFQLVQPQITVAQIALGLANEVHHDGWIGLPSSMQLAGRGDAVGYSLPSYLEAFESFETAPTLIVLGPSEPSWSDEMNQKRLAAILPHLRHATKRLWNGLSEETIDMVWRMVA